nr:unnamed protein product [Digitaria exilis]
MPAVATSSPKSKEESKKLIANREEADAHGHRSLQESKKKGQIELEQDQIDLQHSKINITQAKPKKKNKSRTNSCSSSVPHRDGEWRPCGAEAPLREAAKARNGLAELTLAPAAAPAAREATMDTFAMNFATAVEKRFGVEKQHQQHASSRPE